MPMIDTLIHAKWIIPVEPEGLVLNDHSLAIENGSIVAITPTASADRDYTANKSVFLPDHALIPGLVNSHTHAAMTLMRGFADDLPLMDWLDKHIWPTEANHVNEEFVKDGTELAIAEMIRSGTTCMNDMYYFPNITASACQKLGLRAVIGLILLDFPSVWASNAEEYISKGTQVHDEARVMPLVTTAFAPHAPYTVSDEPLEKIRVLADQLEVPIHMHLHETLHEVSDYERDSGQRPIERLEKLGLLSSRFIAVHMTQLSAAEIDTVAKLNINVVHCPESNLKLASGFCPVNDLLNSGVNVALGTDGPASNNDLDMLGELNTAALLAKCVSGNAAAVPAATALRMATLNGAKALGLEEQVGSIEVGKRADLTALNLSDLSTQPVYDPVSQVVYSAQRNQVTDVWVDGHHQLSNCQLIRIDEASLLHRIQLWKEKLDPRGAAQ